MRTRPLIVALLVGTTSVVFLAGCSGKPENAPAIRKKFAEYDKAAKTVDELNATVASLTDEVKRLSNENSELRTFLPEVDGQSAVSKLTALEGRLSKLESGSATVASATTTTAPAPGFGPEATVASTTTTANPDKALEEAPLAGSAPAAAATATNTTAPAAAAPAAPEAPKTATKEAKKATEQKAVASSFKDKTGPKKEVAAKSSNSKIEVKSASATRGSFHTIAAGETADAIAAQYKISKEALLKANGIPAGVRLPQGQRLYIPAAK